MVIFLGWSPGSGLVCARDIAEALTAGQTLGKPKFDASLARVRNGLTRLS
jgi:hypothetical protein